MIKLALASSGKAEGNLSPVVFSVMTKVQRMGWKSVVSVHKMALLVRLIVWFLNAPGVLLKEA